MTRSGIRHEANWLDLGKTRRGFRVRAWSAALLVALCLGCDGDEEPLVCKTGETRICVGPGACAGGQECDKKGQWGSCQCGSGRAGAAGDDDSGSGGTDGIGDADGGQATGGSRPKDAGASGNFECPTDLPGRKLVRIPAPDGSAYCIDSTEVLWEDYAEFLSNAPAPIAQNQDPRCDWNSSYEESENKHINGPEGHPVTSMDWCDAVAYCRWAGKHLCGKIGGGPLGWDTLGDTAESEWYNACSRGGTRAYPYGDDAKEDACNDMVTVADPACEGGYSGVFDMTGGIREWTDECNGESKEDYCALRGGAYYRLEPCYTAPLADSGIRLDWSNRAIGLLDIGFRCCHREGDAAR